MSERRRKSLSEYLRAGSRAIPRDFVEVGGYYGTDERVENAPLYTVAPPHVFLGCATNEWAHEAGPLFGADPILMIFVGKFGPDILKSIGTEHRRSFDDGWDRGRVWDREHVNERLTKAINGGLFELHRRLHETPRLDSAIRRLGYRGEARFTSVFRAITWMNDVARKTPAEIADILEEARL